MSLLNSDRATALMRRCGLDAIVATSPCNVLYLSGYSCWIDPLFKAYMMRPGAASDLNHNYAVLPLAGDPALILPAMWAANAESAVDDLWLHGIGDLDLSAVPHALAAADQKLLQRVEAGRRRADAVDALRDVLVDRRLSTARIGVELEGLSATEQARLRNALPRADVRDCSNLLRVIRMVKSLEELRRLERSTQINSQAALATLREARVGTTLRDLRQRYAGRIAELGAELDHFIASPHGTGLKEVPDYRLEDGDVLYVDYGCVFENYYSDNGTTLVMGDFPHELKYRYEVLRAGLEAGVEHLRPGVKASEIRQAMIDVLAHGGVSGSNAHGHGIGLEVRDYPIIVPDTGLRIHDECVDLPADLPLEEDMVVNLELPLYLFGAGSLHMEQTFAITATGSRRLDSSEPTEPIVRTRETVAV